MISDDLARIEAGDGEGPPGPARAGPGASRRGQSELSTHRRGKAWVENRLRAVGKGSRERSMGPPRRVPALRSGQTTGRNTHYNPTSLRMSSEPCVRRAPGPVAFSPRRPGAPAPIERPRDHRACPSPRYVPGG